MFEHGWIYKARSIAYLLLLLLKLFLSWFVSKRQAQHTIFISWHPLHSKLADRIGKRTFLLEVNNSLSGTQIALYREASLLVAIRRAVKTFKVNRERERTGYDNFFFCIAFMLEFQMFEKLVSGSRHVLMAGQLDRYAIILSSVCSERKIYFSFVQHGVNNIFEGLHRIHADEIYYLFEMSIPFFKGYIVDAEKKKYLPIPQSRPNFKPDPKFRNAIAFASQIMESDLILLDIMVEYYQGGDILIYPHPTEKNFNFYKKYRNCERVTITRERISNLRYVISTGSTLGIDYDLIGVTPVFVNLNDFNSEVFHSDRFVVFRDVETFKAWFIDMAQASSQ